MSAPRFQPSLREVLAQLEADGVLPPSPSRQEAAHAALQAGMGREGTPWFVRLLVGLGSLVAMCLLLGVLALLGLLRGPEGALTVGALLVAGAFFAGRAGHTELMASAVLTVSFAGELLFIGGVGALAESARAGAFAALLLEALLLVGMADRTHRFASVVAMGLSLVVLLHEAPGWSLDVLSVAMAAGLHALVQRRPRLEAGRAAPFVAAAVPGLAVSVFLLLTYGVVASMDTGFEREVRPLLGPLATVGLAAVALVSSRAIAREHPEGTEGRALLLLRVTLVLLAALTLSTPGLLAALGVAGLAFHRRDRLLLGLALLFGLGFGVAYYYQLSLSLLVKSGVLVGSGLVLLAVRGLLSTRAAPPSPSLEVSP